MDTPGIEVRPITDMTDEPALLRGVLHRRAGAGRRTSSASRATRSSRRCASSSTSAAASTGSCRTAPSTRSRWSGPTRPIRVVRQEIAATRDRLPDRADPRRPRGAEAGARRVLARRPSASAPSTSSGSPSSCGAVLGADGDAVGRRRPTASPTRPATRSWAARRTSCATSSASGCSASPASRSGSWTVMTSRRPAAVRRRMGTNGAPRSSEFAVTIVNEETST